MRGKCESDEIGKRNGLKIRRSNPCGFKSHLSYQITIKEHMTMWIIQLIWCLPQNLLGLFVFLITKMQGSKTEKYKDIFVTYWKYSSGLSLGQFIFVPISTSNNTIRHEYGHSRQSLILGWLYLFIVGIPSIIWAGCFSKYRSKHNISYYSKFPENWADKLGRVIR